ncbi:peroxiredoxin [Tropicimonas sp. TH_r6]|uniref:peroxiredoxin n=1 Tax=Tropicimonas sp. TH_r6 TaxID=3082085 RepID=UPI002954D9D7|nr:peroxiredoxin [Tropicimonas sp. TH_r6]MDV7142005.1 peroxiredoxin [Tropicimonas sp. TH_r6]
MHPNFVPEILFHTRVRNDALEGPNPFEWKQVSSSEIFADRRIVLFALPGAFTPACSESHLPGFEAHYDAFVGLGVDQVICLSVNDAFVMHQWARSLGIDKVSMLPDGNGDFSRGMGMLVDRSNQGMGRRSWRYSMYVENTAIRKVFSEPGFQDNPTGVPVQVSDARTLLAYLRSR